MPRRRDEGVDDLDFTLRELFNQVPELQSAWETIREHRPEVSAMSVIGSMLIAVANEAGHGVTVFKPLELLQFQNQIASTVASQIKGHQVSASFDKAGKLVIEELASTTLN